MSVWGLRLRSLFSSVNWYAEVTAAYEAADWPSFVYCLKQDRSLLSIYPNMPGHPLHLSLLSHDWSIVQQVLELGARLDAPVTGEALLDKMDSKDRFALERKIRFPDYPGYDLIRETVLVIAWLRSSRDVYEKLVPLVDTQILFRTFLWSLLLNDRDWIQTFDMKSELNQIYQFQGYLEINPLMAAIFGNCDVDTFKNLWSLTPAEQKWKNFYVSTSPPGHEEGNHKCYEGDELFWAQHLQRQDIIEFLLSVRE